MEDFVVFRPVDFLHSAMKVRPLSSHELLSVSVKSCEACSMLRVWNELFHVLGEALTGWVVCIKREFDVGFPNVGVWGWLRG